MSSSRGDAYRFDSLSSYSSRSVRLTRLSITLANFDICSRSPTKASFTSLSTKVGEIVGELHLALNSILAKPVLSDQTDVRVAVLKLAARLASCSPYGRMNRSLADPIAKAVLSNLDNEGEH